MNVIYIPRTRENITNCPHFIFWDNVFKFSNKKNKNLGGWNRKKHIKKIKIVPICLTNWQLEFNEMKTKTLYKERTVDWSKPWIVSTKLQLNTATTWEKTNGLAHGNDKDNSMHALFCTFSSGTLC